MSSMSDPEHVRAQYTTEDRLETRRSVWRPTDDGLDPETEALRAIDRALVGDAHVLEVGCGTGLMAERIHDLPGVTLVATDFSPRFVELTAARGVDARQADICYLPFEDDAFDVVYAGWMLYHVRDLDRALAEVRRVLRPGGTFVAVTNGDDSLADLRREAGGRYDGPGWVVGDREGHPGQGGEVHPADAVVPVRLAPGPDVVLRV